MNFPVQIEQTNGCFTASVLWTSHIRAIASTREEALSVLKTDLDLRVQIGELVNLDIPTVGVTTFAGVFKDDPTLDEIVAEAYRQRDAESYE
jgi:hypothetical protein